MRSVFRCLLGILLICWLSQSAFSDERIAITDPASVDHNFHLQGEYFGSVSAESFDGAPYMGLQLVSLGHGNFDGRLLQGGLPGAGWDRRHFTQVAGGRDGDRAALAGSVYTVSVTPGGAVVRSDTGTELARLPKIHRISTTQGAAPPPGAVVLFAGRSTSQLDNGKMTPEGLLDVGASTKMKVRDFRMHLEFQTPYMPNSRGQARGNSGIYIQQRYEVQVLDSFGLEGVENECGGLYRQRRPDVNMCFPPLSWQTYDIYFTAARFNSQGEKTANARITVLHNGEAIHSDYSIVAKTGAGKQESAEPGPILFQNHKDPVRYRNIWIVPAGHREPSRVCPPVGIPYACSHPSLIRYASGCGCCR